ncbi:MAG: hybrid sensor histidine kinase/response regulator [Magnetococcales bacterium]|nr:hybrid sensor histidine kinase/response regulator [Magnetococcales bacterium]MBF0113817.1 hybrid sensor histidine kinase/response regulator [Magnetococcales bacterium]
MIEDQELRELFAAESEEHLHQLEAGLLHLEKRPDDLAMLKELFREAHSLKGAARMLGVRDVETLAHHFEDFLGAASKGQRSFTAMDVDRLTRSLDDMRALVEEAVSGKPAPVSLPEALRRLNASTVGGGASRATAATGSMAPQMAAAAVTPVTDPPSTPPPLSVPAQVVSQALSAVPLPTAPPTPAPTVLPVVSEPALSALPVPLAEAMVDGTESPPESVAPEGSEPLVSSEETAPVIRVRSNKLDALLRLVGELTVVRTRVKRRLTEIEELLALWEEHARLEGGALEQRSVVAAGMVLERRHDAMLEQIGNRLSLLRQGISEDDAGLELVSESLEEGIRNLRLLPLSTLFGLFPRMVRDLARQQEKEVLLTTEGGETTADKRILEEMKSPLMHLIRNAVDHGLEGSAVRERAGKPRQGSIVLRAAQTATHVLLEVRDDGRGLDLEAIKRQARKRGLLSEELLAGYSSEQLYGLIFQSGFSTSTIVTDVSGRGVGLDVVRTQVERLKGRIAVTSEPNRGCCFTISLPVTLATTPVFIAVAAGQHFAVPLDFVHSVRRVMPEEIFPMEGCDTIVLQERPVSVARLAQLLELPASGEPTPPPPWPCILLNLGSEGWLGLICDGLEDELEVVLKPFGGVLQRVRNLSGTTILGSGRVCMVVNPRDLLLSVRKHGRRLTEATARAAMPIPQDGGGAVPKSETKKTILLAEDSLTTRTQEKRILQSAGYEVIAAVDGLDALNKLGKQPIDAVVSDVQMPNLDGLALVEQIRQNPLYKDLPVILVTSLSSDEDMRRGMEAGANAYITKPTFEQKIFLETLQRLV